MRKFGEAAEWSADEALAVVEGFVEGWFRPSPQPVSLNSATQLQLESLPGITSSAARRIIRSRPYHDKRELVKRGVVSESVYDRIKDDIAVR